MNYILIRWSLFTALLGFSFALPGFGCQCAGVETPAEAGRRAMAVFVGKITALNHDGDYVLVRVHVTERFKGISKDSSEMEIQTPSGGPACGFSFLIGQSYLIYASRGYVGPGLGVDHCSRTQRLDQASEDLKFLRSAQ